VAFDRRLSEIRLPDKDYPGLSYALAKGILAKVQQVVRDLLRSTLPLPVEVQVDGLATVRLCRPKTGSGSSVAGCEISPVAQLRRIMQNGLLRVAPQIPVDRPGVVVVEADHMPSSELAAVTFETLCSAGPEELARVAALLILPQEYAGGWRSPILLRNERVNSPVATHSIGVLERAFGVGL
jgi:hypothetical protein